VAVSRYRCRRFDGGYVDLMQTADDAHYASWKGWGTNAKFGALTKGDEATFRTETSAFKRIERVLEIGFGEGSFMTFCRKQGWIVTGTELNQILVEAARTAGFDAHLARDAEHVLSDATFDLIAAFDVLEHIPPDDAIAFLAVLKAKLSPGGTILLRFPNADTWLGNVAQHGDPTHTQQIGYFKLQYFAKKAGLDITDFRGQARLGFAYGWKRGIHNILTTPIILAIGWISKLLHYPGVPVVLTSQNIIAVLVPADSNSTN
jgi:2-polyprenyl-3-methyl-5-hydroxy-6-metoxy-1,4-benzoquinol methylase